MVEELIKLFGGDLNKLGEEISLFKNDEELWALKGAILNSAGNLCLHLVGNLNTYIGNNIGQTGYVRDRAAEFSTKDLLRADLISMVMETRKVVTDTLRKVDPTLLEQVYPEKTLGYEMTTRFFLLHLSGHLAYHLGQINYLRRALDQ